MLDEWTDVQGVLQEQQRECPECGAAWDAEHNRCTAQCQERV
jgi:ribosomal protein S27AE